MQTKLLSVRSDIKRRFEDIEMMENILEKNKKVDNQLILKSSLMLMIYNVVEGVMSNLLTDFFDILHSRNIEVNDLPENLQKTICKYWNKKNGINDLLINSAWNENIQNVKFELSYNEITRHLKLFSGNLDSREIRAVSERLGVILSEGIDEPVLLKVKNSRNKLAHGDTRFNNACQDFTLDDMKKIEIKTKCYLDKVICEYEKFLDTI